MRTFAAILIILLASGVVDAFVIGVPEDFLAIQDAIRFSQDGDTVLVEPGSYRGSINFLGRAVVLLGSPENPELTEIYGNFASVVSFNNGEDEHSVVKGFTISRGRAADGGGIVIENASPMIENCIITRNSATTAGGGVFVADASHPQFVNCLFTNNRTSRMNGGAVAVFTSSDCSFYRCVFFDNFAEERGGAIYGCNDSQINLINCTVVLNKSPHGGAIYSWNASILIANSIIWDNGNSPLFSSGESNVISFSDVEFGENGVNGDFHWDGQNTSAPPEFTDFLAGNFSLRPFSPCIDGGNPESTPDPDGSLTDMGAIPTYLTDDAFFYCQPCSLRFSQTPIEGFSMKEMIVRNMGREELNVECVLADDNFTCQAPQLTLSPHQIGIIPFSFSPERERQYNVEATLFTNDPQRQEIPLQLNGHGYLSPMIWQPDRNIVSSVDSGQTVESTLNITNDGVGNLHWRIEIENESDGFPDGIQPRPTLRNQEVGAILQRFQIDFAETHDLAWDGELIWGSVTQQVIALDPESEEVRHILRIFPNPDAIEIVDDELWAYSNQNPRRLNRYDFDGELISRVDLPFEGLAGLCFDGHQTVYYLSNAQRLYKSKISRLENVEYLDIIKPVLRDGYTSRNLTFVPGHFGGQLWTITGRELDDTFFLTRISVNMLGQFETVGNFPLESGNFSGLAHNGRNLLWGGDGRHMNWFALQDGIRETEWLTIEPMAGELAAEADQDVFLTLSGSLPLGQYQNKIHIKSNDAESPDIVLSIDLTILDPAAVFNNTDIMLLPENIALLPNFPNPFNSSTQIRFGIPRQAKTTLKVFDSQGALVETMQTGEIEAGWHAFNWDCQRIPSGVYFARLTMGSESFTIKMILLE